jgi:hypothetical protein
MKRVPQLPGVDLSIYWSALPLLVRNPSIVVVPLLMAVIGVLLARIFPIGASSLGGLTGGLVWLLTVLLILFGLGTACVIADDAWRHSRASFDRDWTEARRRAPEILFAALGVTFVIGIAQYVATFLGGMLALILTAIAAFFLIWTIPAAAIGGVPGGAALQVSIDRVRSNPLSAAIAAIVTIVLTVILAPLGKFWIESWLAPYTPGMSVGGELIGAVLEAIAISYSALIITKSYADAAFGRRY